MTVRAIRRRDDEQFTVFARSSRAINRTRRTSCTSAAFFAVFALAVAQDPPATVLYEARLDEIRAEIGQLERALGELQGTERGILGELDKLDAELQLRQSEVRESAARIDEITAVMERHDATITRLDAAQDDRRRYLAFRLREVYKAGSDQALRRLLAGEELEGYWDGLSYASFLSERDAKVLDAFRGDAKLSEIERARLAETREALATEHRDLEDRTAAVERARSKRASALETVRRDGGRHRAALQELRDAADELGRVAEALSDTGEAAFDVRQFKGLLDWPADGELRAGFGTVVHPQFKTKVPHPGWDIAADFGANVSAVFDGEVLFADWMRGYGLTAIVDHGNEIISIYSHASVLLVEAGERVSRGQLLGKVGETGSLRGAFLYFELRVDGAPVDPADWLRNL